jgi:hypothetical protein
MTIYLPRTVFPFKYLSFSALYPYFIHMSSPVGTSTCVEFVSVLQQTPLLCRIFPVPNYNCIYVFEFSQRLINCWHFEFQHRVVVAFSDVSEEHTASVSTLSESHLVGIHSVVSKGCLHRDNLFNGYVEAFIKWSRVTRRTGQYIPPKRLKFQPLNSVEIKKTENCILSEIACEILQKVRS